MMVCTKGNTNRECSFFCMGQWGLVGYRSYRSYRRYRGYRGDSTAWVAEVETETEAEAGACLPYDAVAFFAAGVVFFGGADFFFAKRLFFRYGEGCEGRASRATVAGEWGYNGENSFSALSPFACSRQGVSPHIPTVAAFCSFPYIQSTYPKHTSKAYIQSTYPKHIQPSSFRLRGGGMKKNCFRAVGLGSNWLLGFYVLSLLI